MNIPVEKSDNDKLTVNINYVDILQSNNIRSAEQLWNISGQAVKNVVKERGTERCELKLPGNSYLECFIKRYQPIPFREKLKNTLCFKPFKFDAVHEWNTIMQFHHLGLATMTPIAVATTSGGCSCNLTLGIENYIRASELLPEAPTARKRNLIRSIAEYAGKMHLAGLAHQDLYLVHFFIRPDEDDRVYLIDLQRVIQQEPVARRWRVKDLAQLLFSASPYLSKTEIMLFWKIYTGFAGHELFRNQSLIKAVMQKAERIRLHDEKRAARRAAAQ